MTYIELTRKGTGHRVLASVDNLEVVEEQDPEEGGCLLNLTARYVIVAESFDEVRALLEQAVAADG